MTVVPHNRIIASDDDVAAVASVVRSGHWAMGPATELLEAELARSCGRKEAVAVASGLSALRLALLAVGVKAHDRVGVPAYSCVALANAVLSIGAVPVAIDCDSASLNIDCNDERILSGLGAIVAVNTFGMPADLAALDAFAVPVIEDCSHGFGHGRLGRQGTAAVISLHATKFVGAGRGGAILTDDEALAGRLRDWREYDDKPAWGHALNEKPDDLNAALALNRLRGLSDAIERRRNLALRYQRDLAAAAREGRIGLPVDSDERVWYRYAIRTDDIQWWLEQLRACGIGAAMPVMNWLLADELSRCPIARSAYRSIVSLPLFPTLTDAEQAAVIAAVNDVAGRPR